MYFAVSGPALARLGDFLHEPRALLADPRAQTVLMHSSPAVVLADPAPKRLHAGEGLGRGAGAGAGARRGLMTGRGEMRRWGEALGVQGVWSMLGHGLRHGLLGFVRFVSAARALRTSGLHGQHGSKGLPNAPVSINGMTSECGRNLIACATLGTPCPT